MKKNVYIESAFINRSKNGTDFLSLNLKQSAFNKTGAGADVVRTMGANGKEYNTINVKLKPSNPDGIYKGLSEAERLGKAAGFEEEMKELMDPKVRDEILKERNGYVDSLKHKGFNLELYNSAKDKKPNSVYTRNVSGDLVPPRIEVDGQYKTNPEARFAVFGKIEETITPDPNFSYEKHKELLSEFRAAKRENNELKKEGIIKDTPKEAPSTKEKEAEASGPSLDDLLDI